MTDILDHRQAGRCKTFSSKHLCLMHKKRAAPAIAGARSRARNLGTPICLQAKCPPSFLLAFSEEVSIWSRVHLARRSVRLAHLMNCRQELPPSRFVACLPRPTPTDQTGKTKTWSLRLR